MFFLSDVSHGNREGSGREGEVVYDRFRNSNHKWSEVLNPELIKRTSPEGNCVLPHVYPTPVWSCVHLRVQSGAFMAVISPQQPTAYHVHLVQRGLLATLILVLSYSLVVDKGKHIIDTGMSNVQLWRWLRTDVRDLRESGDDYASIHFSWPFKYWTYLHTWLLRYQVPAAEKEHPVFSWHKPTG